MAPLRGVTLYTFRAIYSKHFLGVDSAVAPFISTTQCATVSPKLVKDISKVSSLPLTPQILGNNSNILLPYLKKFLELGSQKQKKFFLIYQKNLEVEK